LSHATWRNSLSSLKETIGITQMAGAPTIHIKETTLSSPVALKRFSVEEVSLAQDLQSQEPLSCLLIMLFKSNSNSGRWTLGIMKNSYSTLTTNSLLRKTIKSVKEKISATMSMDGTLKEKMSTSGWLILTHLSLLC